MVEVGVFRPAAEGEIGATAKQDFKGGGQLKPCKGRADAKMHPGAKTGIGLDGACGIEAVGVLPDICVAVSGGEQQPYLVAPFKYVPE